MKRLLEWAPVVALLLLSGRALAEDDPTFCGNEGDPASKASSVWYRLNHLEGVGCRSCHDSNSSWPADSGVRAYVRGAMEMDILRDWIASSYWAPGVSKAQASYLRVSFMSMPPRALWPEDPKLHLELRDLLTTWVNQTWVNCANQGQFPDQDSQSCIWGTATETVQAGDVEWEACNWDGGTP